MKFSKYKIDEFYLIVICGFLTTTIFCINLKQNKDTVTDQGPEQKGTTRYIVAKATRISRKTQDRPQPKQCTTRRSP